MTEDYCYNFAENIYQNLKVFEEPRVDRTNVENLITKYSVLNNIFVAINNDTVTFRSMRKLYANVQDIYTTLRKHADYWILDLYMNSLIYPQFALTFYTFEQNIRDFIMITETYDYEEEFTYDSFVC